MIPNNRGSALIVVIITMSIVTLLTLGGWRRASMNRDLIMDRERYYKNFYLTELILLYGSKIAQKYFDDFLEKSPLDLDMTAIATHRDATHRLVLRDNNVRATCVASRCNTSRCTISKAKCNSLRITARLFLHNKVVQTLSSTLSFRGEDGFFIDNFSIGPTF